MMLSVGFLLGFMGSMHCIGMCGPLSLMACSQDKKSKFVDSIQYNLGRVVTYSILGGIFGILGTFLFVSQAQKWVTILMGFLMILTCILQQDIDKLIGHSSVMGRYTKFLQNMVSLYFTKAKNYSPLFLGMLNGFLPCGLVYLALAGALNCTHWTDSMGFMIAFGLGTIPAMLGLFTGYKSLSLQVKQKFKQLLPLVTLCFGCFLIYRGIVIDMPLELDFWLAMKNPILCH